MANHVSSEKRARQTIKRSARNAAIRSAVHTAERSVRSSVGDKTKAEGALKNAFSVIQKSRGTLHRNTIRRKMAKLAKAVASAAKKTA